MGLARYLTSLTKPELERLTQECNFSDDEQEVFDMLSRNKSTLEISFKLGLSKRTTDRRIENIKRKVDKINGKNN